MKKTVALISLTAFLAACGGAAKQRAMQREKLSSEAGLYCEFISGDEFPDVDVQLNIAMAKRCDSEKTFSISGYKNAADNHGIVYCCSTKKKEEPSQSEKAGSSQKSESGKKGAASSQPSQSSAEILGN
ncbi:MAG: hypothetical protein N2578_07270 [Bdellovibrionaceae bacterium]|nr:hypothetical protein [Pseudobdellovibrionaceae bacterium]